jgi:myo-inositol-1(or 4)-monophosphatase
MKGFATALAMEAGEIQRRCVGKSKDVEHKGAIDLVTQVDRRCEEMIVSRISEFFPHHHVVAEESQRRPTGNAYQWYVDPLDGTTNYVHGYPCFAVSIALAVEGEIVLGVVSDPMREETFSATKGDGAFLNGVSISVSKTKDLDDSLLATGFPYDVRESQNNNLDHFARFSLSAQGVRRDGSAALDLCYVAMGRFDGFWEMKLHPWDLAAGALIVTEARGRVSDFEGGPFKIESGEVLATNGLIHQQMASVLNESWIQKGVRNRP